MADASFLQPHFQGGEVSPFYQGRLDDQTYRVSMNLCRNALPMEEGGWTRRAGTRFCAPTYQGKPAVLRTFHFNQTNPYALELTDSVARLFAGPGLVTDTYNAVTAVSAANPAVVTTITAHGWNTGDEVFFVRNSTDTNFSASLLLGRWFQITVLSSTTFSLTDSITGATFDGSTVTLGRTRLAAARVFHMDTPYGAKGTSTGFDKTTLVQGPGFAVMLHPNVRPQLVATQVLPSETSPGTFTWQPLLLLDGPYLDPPTDGSTVTPSGTSGLITLTQTLTIWSVATTYNQGDVVSRNGLGYTSLVGSNTGNFPETSSGFWQLNVFSTQASQSGFQQSDIGRSIRFLSEPAAWNNGTAYTVGQLVKYGGAYWSALGSTTGSQPDISPTAWQVAPGAAVWSWGVISGYTSASSVTVAIRGGNLLNTNAMVYRLGVYSDTTGWPTAGAYQEGRLWLGGTLPNRIDASQSNQPFNFAPTLVDGTVADNCGISAPFQSETNNAVYWMAPENQGVVIGTKGGEFVVQATNLNEALTPSTVMVRKTTKFGAENIPPVRTPMSLMFVQRHGRKLIEYVADVYTSKYSGTNIAKKASHLTATGIAEIAFQAEVVPTLWLRMNDGTFKGLLYKRESPFGTQPAEFVGWFRNDLGNGRKVESLQGSPSQDGSTDSVMMVTSDGTTRWVEMLANQFEVGDDVAQGWFLDAGMPAQGAQIVGGNSLKFSGYYYQAGQTLDFNIAGLDMGQVVVAADGTVTVPFANNAAMNTAYLAAVTAKGLTYDAATVSVPISLAGGSPDFGHITSFKQTDGLTGMTVNQGAFDFDRDQALVVNGLSQAGMARYQISTGIERKAITDTAWGALVYTSVTGSLLPAADTQGLHLMGTNNGGNGVSMDGSIGLFLTTCSITNQGIQRVGLISTIHPFTNALKISNRIGVAEGGGAANGSIPALGENTALRAGGFHLAVISSNPNFNGQVNVIDLVSAKDLTPTTGGGATSPMGGFIGFTGFGPQGINGHYIRHCAGFQSTWPGFNYGEALYVNHMNPQTLTNTDVPLTIGKIICDAGHSSYTLGGSATYTATSFLPGVVGLTIASFNAPIYDPYDDAMILGVTISQYPNWVNSYPAGVHVTGSNGHSYFSLSSTVGVDPTTDGGVHWRDDGLVSAGAGSYLAKVYVDTGAVVWLTAMSLTGDASRNNTRLTGLGTLWYLGGDGFAWKVDTATGTKTNMGSISSITSINGQVYDDVTGTMVVGVNGYNVASGSGSPAPINGTANSFASLWATLLPASPGLRSLYSFSATGGVSFISQGQILRPLGAEESGARNGPALGKTRRLHQFGALLGTCVSGKISFGTNFTDQLQTQTLSAYENGPGLAGNVLFNGVVWDTMPDDYGYDGMLCWQVSRPVPATVMSVEGFLHTQDR